MVKIELTYLGNLRCEAVHTPSGTKLETDAPTDNHGKGEKFSPTDLVATAYGSCIATILGMAAARLRVDLDGMKLSVVKEMAPRPHRRVGSLLVEVSMPAGISEAHREKLEEAALLCPVGLSLHPDVEKDVVFNYPDQPAPSE